MVRGKVDKGFGEGCCVGMVCKTKGGGADKVSEGIQCHFLVTVIPCPLVYGKKGQDGGDIGAV